MTVSHTIGTVLGRRFLLPGFRVGWSLVSLDDLRRRVGCDVRALPRRLAVVAWDHSAGGWSVCLGGDMPAQYRVPSTLRFLERRVRPRLSEGSFWFLCCFRDGWGEQPRPDDPPEGELVSPTRPDVLCYAARTTDRSAVLLPESHYLERFHYARFRAEARTRRPRWEATRPTAIFCGSPHGRALESMSGAQVPRTLLREVVENEGLDVKVHLGGGVSLAEQRAHRYLIDVDGFVRTFDAWAWKLLSGSLVLSQESPWETFFTRQFEPWQHFVPIAEDFSDLGDRLAWCRTNDDVCREIAQRGKARALEVYDIDRATAVFAPSLTRSLTAAG